MTQNEYGVIVIGGGHAGCEAALASARMGVETLLLTMKMGQVAQMSCNPAIGGLAKGHLVREIDALGGEMAKCIDATGIQFRVLNTSKGPAVWGYRAQADRRLYRGKMQKTIEEQPRLSIEQGMVTNLMVADSRVNGVITSSGVRYRSACVVLCSGTFLNGLIHVGLEKHPAGRAGESPATGLTENLRKLGFETGRLKTGTPPRLDGNTINYAMTQTQPGDARPRRFSFFSSAPLQPQVMCHITWTNQATQEVIERNLHRSPLYTGVIQGVGPRYCPSIEDKVKRFPDKRRHQVFLEPEGLDTAEIYPNGVSTSLPADAQLEFLRTIPGLENVEMTKPGYAIEYDFFPPTQVYPTLETKPVKGLFFAGQINGTSGYEEAGAQGIVAGINSARLASGKEPITFPRSDSYIGVLIDDLTTKGTQEPYRMFTSRAEFRLLLRPDNADERLCDIGHTVGLLDNDSYKQFREKRARINREMSRLHDLKITPGALSIADEATLGGAIPSTGSALWELLKRPAMKLGALPLYETPTDLRPEEAERIETQCKYEGYIKRQEKLALKTRKSENRKFPADFDFNTAPGLSHEAREKLNNVRPISLAQAGRIPGVTPAQLSILHIYLEKLARQKTAP